MKFYVNLFKNKDMQFKLIAFISSSLLLFGCGSDENEDGTSLENNFHIEGKIEHASMTPIKVVTQTPQGMVTVAESTTDANGAYSFDGNIPSLGMYSMVVGQNQENAVPLTLNVGDELVINGELNSFAINPSISGTNWAKPLMNFLKIFRKFGEEQEKLSQSNLSQEQMLVEYAKLQKPLVSFSKKQIQKDPSNPVNLILCSNLMPSQTTGFNDWDKANMSILLKMQKAFEKAYVGSPISKSLSEQIQSLNYQYEEHRKMTSGTFSAPEIVLNDPNGNERRLSSLKGKVVLLDFWASWCGPCRKENPNVVRMYKQYKSKGFEIFSVSLDKDPGEWKKAIQSDGLIWENHVCDFQEWQTPLVQIYNLQSIPQTFLLNKEGNIIAIGLRGKELEQKLQEVLN